MDDVQKAMRDKFPALHPLLFHRSVEKAKTNGGLFDLLHGMPPSLPIVWDAAAGGWTQTDNLLQAIIKDKGGTPPE
jgi:hypothetical protein